MVLSIEKAEIPSLILTRKNIWRKEESVSPEKEVRREIRVRAKARSTKEKDKTRRAEVKKLKKLAMLICEVMEVERDELLDDLGP